MECEGFSLKGEVLELVESFGDFLNLFFENLEFSKRNAKIATQ